MGLPTEYPVEMKQLLIAIRADKKREGNGIYLVFPRAIGECSVEMVNTDSLEDILPRRGEGTPETGAAVRRTGRSPGSSRKSQRLRSSLIRASPERAIGVAPNRASNSACVISSHRQAGISAGLKSGRKRGFAKKGARRL